MKISPTIFFAAMTIPLAFVGCESSAPRVISDHSIASQFAGFNKSGWSVTGGGVATNDPRQKVAANDPRQKVTVTKSSNPFANPVWNTNFRVDDPATPNAATGARPPTPSSTTPPPPPALGGFVLPPAPGAVTDPPPLPPSH